MPPYSREIEASSFCCLEVGRATRKQVGQHLGRRPRERRVPGGVRREVRKTDDRLEVGIHVRGARVEVEVLRVPASDGSVVQGHVEQRERPRSPHLAELGASGHRARRGSSSGQEAWECWGRRPTCWRWRAPRASRDRRTVCTSATSRAIKADEVDGGGPGRSLTMSAGVIIQVRTLPKTGSIGGRAGTSMLFHGISPRAAAAFANACHSAGEPPAVLMPSVPARATNTAATACPSARPAAMSLAVALPRGARPAAARRP